MPANAFAQTRIDPAVKERASEVLEEMGITVSDVLRSLLTRTANEGALPFALTADGAVHDGGSAPKCNRRAAALGKARSSGALACADHPDRNCAASYARFRRAMSILSI
jgi:addiction module RelB/DinJ family antitoxin